MEAVEKAFNDHSIPYQVIGDTPFFQQEPVKSIIDLLKLSLNPANDFLKEQLLCKKIISPLELPLLIEVVRETSSPRDSIARIVERCFAGESGEQAKNEPLFKRLLQLAELYEAESDSRDTFLKFATLGTAVDTYKPDLEKVTLMTLHAAKGLEFRCVFIVGCEEGLLPYSLFQQRESDREEERRLLYVGMTRAQTFLFLSHAEKRWIGGREYHLKRSSFLDTIEKELIELAQQKLKKKEEDELIQRSLFE
jgi:superfamily I DNA/RNA helicase